MTSAKQHLRALVASAEASDFVTHLEEFQTKVAAASEYLLSTGLAERSEGLDRLRDLAEEYTRLDKGFTGAGKTKVLSRRMRDIASEVAQEDALSGVYFSQQLVSHYSDASMASMCLTILSNRIQESLLKP